MLQVELFHRSSDLFGLDFLKVQDRALKIVCPTPDIADSLRKKIKSEVSFDVITVSKFISCEFRRVFPEHLIKTKAEMMLYLGTVFKKMFGSESYRTFFQAFDTFTELRGITTQLNLINEVLEEYPPLIAKSVVVFWSLIDQQEIVDEHETYYLLSEAYREIEHEIHDQETNITRSDNYIFWGFKHMSAGQVDLIRSMAIRHDIYVPCAHSVYAGSKETDWIRWIAPDLSSEESPKRESLRILRYPKNRLGEMIPILGEEPEAIFLATQSPTFEQLNELPLKNAFFKAPTDLFGEKLNKLGMILEGIVTTSVSLTKLTSKLSLIKAEYRNNSELDFRWLKVVSLFEETLLEYSDLSSDHDEITFDDIKLLIHVTSLRLPRNFFVPQVSDPILVRGIEAIETFSPEQANLVCVSSDYSPMLLREERYSDHMLEFLRSVGPVRRSDFIFKITKHQLEEVLSLSNTILLLESGIEEHNAAWNEILGGFEKVEEVEIISTLPIVKTAFTPQKIIKWDRGQQRISSTLLQEYIDCPRKFYLKYIERVKSYLELNYEVLPSELGQIEHSIIENFFQKEPTYVVEKHHCYVKKYLSKEFKSKNLEMLDEESYVEEIINYSGNGLRVLYEIKEANPGARFSFETTLTDKEVTGRIDCLVELDSGIGIIDFKRSSASIPTCAAVSRFEKIQLLFYLNHTQKDVSFVSFVNLSKIEESLGLFLKPAGEEILKSVGIKPYALDYDGYADYEKDLIKKLDNDMTFVPAPMNSSACQYCIISNVCSKEGR